MLVQGNRDDGGRTPLLGRESELNRIMDLLDQGRPLITVTGPPGIGKTRVAQAVLTRARESRLFTEDGLVFCDLSEAWSVADVVDVVASSLDAHLSSGEGSESSVSLLGRAIQGRGPILMVLDNFEQLVDLAPDTISPWIDLAPEARFVVTSRDGLRLRGESRIVLPPLETQEAAALFVATAQRVKESFTVGEGEDEALAALVQRLDGIPLAVELAAARATVMSPRRMLERIDKRFQLLKHGPSDGTPRQATLRAAIDWSWDLLSEPERAALSQCSVFRGGFTLDDGEAVVQIEGDEDVLDLLEALCGKSLVRALDDSSGVRFGIYESIRAYATEHLEAPDAPGGVFERHADHFLNHAEKQILEFGSPEGTDLDWVEANRDNILAICSRFETSDPEQSARAALCIAHSHLRRGPYDSLLTLLEGIPALTNADPKLQTRLHLAKGSTESIMGRRDAALANLEAADGLAEGTPTACNVALHLGLHHLRGGDFEPATAALERAIALGETEGRDRLLARAWVSMGMTHEAVARFKEAEECYTRASDIAGALGDRWELARTRSKMGSLCSFVAGRQAEARSHFEWALSEARAVGDSFIAAGTAYNLGRLELNGAQHEDAEAHLCESLVAYRDMANRVSEGFVRMGLGLLHLDRGSADIARDELSLADEILSEVNHALAGAFTQMTMALALLIDGEIAFADRQAKAALATVVEAKHGVLEGIARCVACVVTMLQDDEPGCVEHLGRARSLLGETDWGEGNSMLAMAEGAAVRVAGGQAQVPDLSVVRHARARIGWRLIAGEAGVGATKDSGPGPDVTVPMPTKGLVVHREGRWFRFNGRRPVDLTRKRTLRPMLLVLAQHRESQPGKALDVDTLFEAVWQGERALPAARKNRIYVAIATLRKSGLEALVTRGDGYLISPDAALHWVD
jgi:predicted ATPase/Tfp pilus assembly protein PilF